ncbi:hypothetical protein [Patulibacter minatonensis]|uniref:hypothetical protein n=1 Tax=Patulibacter minatonensis TaxID=298163 RepID=UPI0004AEE985|nr:hypothetical protein [Patulibacter minatonensis]
MPVHEARCRAMRAKARRCAMHGDLPAARKARLDARALAGELLTRREEPGRFSERISVLLRPNCGRRVG